MPMLHTHDHFAHRSVAFHRSMRLHDLVHLEDTMNGERQSICADIVQVPLENFAR